MYTLYYAPGAASLAVHWLLLELGHQPEMRLLDFQARQQKSADYLALNPAGVVPTLVIDGEPMSEVGAILMYLADTRRPPATRALPVDVPPGQRRAAIAADVVVSMGARRQGK